MTVGPTDAPDTPWWSASGAPGRLTIRRYPPFRPPAPRRSLGQAAHTISGYSSGALGSRGRVAQAAHATKAAISPEKVRARSMTLGTPRKSRGDTPRYRWVVANSGPAGPAGPHGGRTDRLQVGDRHRSTDALSSRCCLGASAPVAEPPLALVRSCDSGGANAGGRRSSRGDRCRQGPGATRLRPG